VVTSGCCTARRRSVHGEPPRAGRSRRIRGASAFELDVKVADCRQRSPSCGCAIVKLRAAVPLLAILKITRPTALARSHERRESVSLTSTVTASHARVRGRRDKREPVIAMLSDRFIESSCATRKFSSGRHVPADRERNGATRRHADRDDRGMLQSSLSIRRSHVKALATGRMRRAVSRPAASSSCCDGREGVAVVDGWNGSSSRSAYRRLSTRRVVTDRSISGGWPLRLWPEFVAARGS